MQPHAARSETQTLIAPHSSDTKCASTQRKEALRAITPQHSRAHGCLAEKSLGAASIGRGAHYQGISAQQDRLITASGLIIGPQI